MNKPIDYTAFNRYSKEYSTFPLVGMTYHWERAFIHWYTKNLYTGQGEIVDLGSWFGSTVVPAARGLVDSSLSMRKKAKRIHAFDRFKWVPSFNNSNTVKRVNWVDKYQPGDSFLPEFLNIIKPWKDYIEAYAGDLLKKTWNGLPIEFIHVDAMKSWDLANRITRQYYSRLLPGDSYIVHQDFAHCEYSFIHLHVYHLREYFEPAFHIPNTCSLVLKNVKRIPDHVIRHPVHPSDFSEQDVEKAYAYCRSLVGKEKESCVAAGQAMFQLNQGNAAGAADTLRQIEAEGLKADPRCDCIDAAWKAVYARGHVGFCTSSDAGVYFGA